MVRWVSFDLDGTLIDTVDDLAAACNGMLKDMGRPTRPLDEVRRFIGRGMQVLVERCLDGEGATVPECLATGIARFRHHYKIQNGRQARLYPGVAAGLAEFRELGLPLVVVTNKPFDFSEDLLARTGLRSYFQFVIGGDTLPVRKPRPEPILHACQQLGHAPSAGLHIGDSRHDLEAARAAGCRYFHVPYGYSDGLGSLPVASQECDALVSDLVDAAHRARHLLQSNPMV